jgi:cellulose synthase/poly-beta-1,6-N-acetylglucosamine synthase-like glycosyltransferase
VARIHRHCVAAGRPYRLEFSAHALCFTEAPHSLADLGKQRLRWHQGLLSTLRIHRSMALSRRFGVLGALTLPYFVLELFAPALETLGWLTLPVLWVSGLLPSNAIVLFIAVGILLSTSVSLAAILVDALAFNHFRTSSDRLRLVACALLEHVGYRQCTIYYRLKGIVRYYSGVHLKSGWKSPARVAQAAPPARG